MEQTQPFEKIEYIQVSPKVIVKVFTTMDLNNNIYHGQNMTNDCFSKGFKFPSPA
jgi:hypothetical protein